MRESIEARQEFIFVLMMSLELVCLLSSLPGLVLSCELIEVHLKMEI